MKEKLFIHTIWWPRQETVALCADRIQRSFVSLGNLDCSWRTWYASHSKISKLGSPEPRIPETVEGLKSYLASASGVAAPKVVTYRLTAMSEPMGGGTSERTVFSLYGSIGAGSNIYNVLSVELPDFSVVPRLNNEELLYRALSSLSQIWDADACTLWDLKAGRNLRPWPAGPAIGWITFLSERVADWPIVLPDGWRWGTGSNAIFIRELGPPDPLRSEDLAQLARMYGVIKWNHAARGRE